ncbi:hypothetical protein KO481_02725 [Nocardia sp. NEAU-G5]|uniref:MFS transporter n=1 Tax=Nocardia albiluteola TaxID=2842303 RepID=A0ABS6ASC2_9NOCA|nr:hypothetical protein [Nocardia albiluteola]MBU3060436.1 hypothetical protein [Nocardia albiluteola]
MMLLTRAGDTSRDRIRGSLAGILCGLVAIAAHGFEGMLPHSSALVLLLLVSGAVGAAVGSPSGRGRAALFGLLAAGQLVEHAALTATAGAHDMHSTVEGAGRGGLLMLTAHGIATLACALLIFAVERFYAAVSRVARTMLAEFGPLPPADDRLARIPRAVVRRPNSALLSAISPRGPPAMSAALALS